MASCCVSIVITYAAMFVFSNTAEDVKLPADLVDPAEDVSNHPNVHLLPLDDCGPRSMSRRISHGRNAGIYELPWMSLNVKRNISSTAVHCAGTIISERYILTAAHCIVNMIPNFVLLGDNALTAKEDCEEQFNGSKLIIVCAPPPQYIPVEEIIQHPKYGSHQHNDIALLRLSIPANFSNGNVRPICLPIGEAQQRNTLIGKNVYISGWGLTEKSSNRSDELLKASVKVKDIKYCRYDVPISPVAQICAGSKKYQVCKGDSGGPLTYFGEVKGSLRVMQYGIISFTNGECGESKELTVYTHVGYYMKWILDNIRP